MSANLVANPTVVQEAVKAADAVGKGGFGAQATLGQLAEFQLTGLLVVFTVLGGLTVMCYLLAWILKTVAPNHYFVKPSVEVTAKAAPAAKRVVPAAQPAVSGIHPGLADEELIAILVAAASEAMGTAVSIVRFRSMDSMDWRWSVQGRVDLHSSHLG
jgi:hypothetical protein